MKLDKTFKLTRPFATVLVVLAVVVAVAAAVWWYRGPYTDSKRGSFGTCPIGYTQYGIPEGCIPNSEAKRCQTEACPICLSNATEIDTQSGRKVVATLRLGDLVWSLDENGRRVLVPIAKTTKRAVPAKTLLLLVMLRDGRSVYVSPNHPTASGKLFDSLRVGDALDGSIVASITPKPYFGGYTYDLLPKTPSGVYWANGILMGSTLKRN